MSEDLAPHIFPTLSRSKHSKLVSYPLGAEILSRALDGVPQHAMIGCTFTAGSMQRDIGKEKILVMSVSYHKRPRSHFDSADAEARGFFNPRWEIWVFTVPSILRAEIKTAIVEIGFPEMVRPWLMANSGVMGKTGSIAMSIEYNRFDKLLVATKRNELLPDRA